MHAFTDLIFVFFSTDDNTIQNALRTLYSGLHVIYWGSFVLECRCQLGSYNPNTVNTSRREAYVSDSNGVLNVQDCEQRIVEQAFLNYSVSFDDYQDLVTYLDYFAEVEEEYHCSGICDYEAVYYFSNSLNGKPDKACYVPIKDELLLGEMLGMGIGFLISGIILSFVLFIQYGLWCRKEPHKVSQKLENVPQDHQNNSEGQENDLQDQEDESQNQEIVSQDRQIMPRTLNETNGSKFANSKLKEETENNNNDLLPAIQNSAVSGDLMQNNLELKKNDEIN